MSDLCHQAPHSHVSPLHPPPPVSICTRIHNHCYYHTTGSNITVSAGHAVTVWYL